MYLLSVCILYDFKDAQYDANVMGACKYTVYAYVIYV